LENIITRKSFNLSSSWRC